MRHLSPWLAALACACNTPDGAEPSETPTEGQLSALTYNVQGLPDALSESTRPTAERMTLISPLLERYDLALLQEDFDPENHELLVAEATHPVREHFDTLVSPERVYGSGLSQLARGATLVEVFEEHYTACNGVLDGASDCLASKGFLILRLSLGGAEIDVYDTHHEAGSGLEDIDARGVQVDQVIASIEGRSAGRAVLFGGDTNLRWSDPDDAPLLQRYADAGLRDVCTELDCPETDHIDRFLMRDGDDLALTALGWESPGDFFEGDDPLSDHPPIVAQIGWSLSP